MILCGDAGFLEANCHQYQGTGPCYPQLPSTQHMRLLTPNIIQGMVFGARRPQYWVTGLSGWRMEVGLISGLVYKHSLSYHLLVAVFVLRGHSGACRIRETSIARSRSSFAIPRCSYADAVPEDLSWSRNEPEACQRDHTHNVPQWAQNTLHCTTTCKRIATVPPPSRPNER